MIDVAYNGLKSFKGAIGFGAFVFNEYKEIASVLSFYQAIGSDGEAAIRLPARIVQLKQGACNPLWFLFRHEEVEDFQNGYLTESQIINFAASNGYNAE